MKIIKTYIDLLDRVKKSFPSLYKNSLEVSIPFFMLHKKLFEKGEQILSEKYALSQSELDVLSILLFSKDKTATPTKLFDLMIFTSGGMTKVLKKLESKNYIDRVESNFDKRSKLVRITPLGEEITHNALQEVMEFEDGYFSKLDENEQKVFKKLLYKMLERS